MKGTSFMATISIAFLVLTVIFFTLAKFGVFDITGYVISAENYDYTNIGIAIIGFIFILVLVIFFWFLNGILADIKKSQYRKLFK